MDDVLRPLLVIGGTLLLLHLFSLRNFAVGNTFARTETVQAALFGFLLLGDRVGPLAFTGILVSLVGLVLLSAARGLAGGVLNRAAAIGLASGAAFAIAAVGYRGASLAVPDVGSFLLRPACTLAFVTMAQSVLLTGWLWWRGGPSTTIPLTFSGKRTAQSTLLGAPLSSAFTKLASLPKNRPKGTQQAT